MDRFRKEIAVSNERRVFEFNKLRNMSGEKFFVTTLDANKKPIAFSLKQTGEHNEWKLVPGSLLWLYAIEGELSKAISERS